MAVIEVSNLVKKFGKRTVLDNLSLSIEENQIFGLLGTNGAGKSTIINILTGLLLPTSGNATILGYDVKKEIHKIRKCIALVPQSLSLYEDLSVKENIEFFAGMYISGKKLKAAIEHVIWLLSLRKFEDFPVKNLSGGNKRRVSIACAIAVEPKILFLDEPLVGIDIVTHQIISKILQNLKTKMTIIYTTHSIKEAGEICDNIVILSEGKCIVQGRPSELIQQYSKKYGEKMSIEFDDSVNIPDVLDSLKKKNFIITNPEIKERKLIFETLNLSHEIISMMGSLKGISNHITDLNIKTPDLEDVFNIEVGVLV